jgi:hypothetical protein
MAKVTLHTTFRGERILFASLIPARSSSAVMPHSMQRCLRSVGTPIWYPSMIGITMRSRLTAESPGVWLVEMRGVADGITFAEVELFVFGDDRNKFWDKLGISILSGSSWRGSIAISSLPYRMSALHEFRSYLDSFECAI